MDSASGTTGGLGLLLSWYTNPVGMVFLIGLLGAVGLALGGQPEASIIVVVAVVAIVVPWKLVRQRSEYRQQIAALQTQIAASQASLDRATEQLNTRLDANSVRPIMQEFRKVDRERFNSLETRLLEVEQEIAPEDDEDEDVAD